MNLEPDDLEAGDFDLERDLEADLADLVGLTDRDLELLDPAGDLTETAGDLGEAGDLPGDLGESTSIGDLGEPLGLLLLLLLCAGLGAGVDALELACPKTRVKRTKMYVLMLAVSKIKAGKFNLPEPPPDASEPLSEPDPEPESSSSSEPLWLKY